MPSRRDVLAAAAGLATAGSVASSGCLAALGAVESGFLSYKGVAVEWDDRGRRSSADLCWVWSDGRERTFGWVDEDYTEIVVAPDDVRVSDAVDTRLRREFLGVTYHLGFSRPGSDHDLLGGDWYVARTSRREFNRVAFGDRAEVLFRFPRAHVLDVHRGAQGDPADWSHEVRTMDFEAVYRDRDTVVPSTAGRATGREQTAPGVPSPKRDRVGPSGSPRERGRDNDH